MKTKTLLVICILTLSILACRGAGGLPPANDPASANDQSGSNGGGSSTLNDFSDLPAGDPARGESLFNGQENDEVQCAACHSLTANQTLVGPSLSGISAAAATRQEGTSTENYLYQSIIEPNSYVVEGFHSDILPAIYKHNLTPQELADLVAFLMSQ
jgi:mono/diheme cytochrome c family protein